MLKTIKYELIRSKLTLVILGCVIGGAEMLFLIGTSPSSTVLGLMLIYAAGMVAYAVIWLMGLLSFSRDLREKSGYMIFLTPVSSYTIIFSKIIAALMELAAAALVLVLLAFMDMGIASARFSRQIDVLRSFSNLLDTTTDRVWAVFLTVWINALFVTLTLYAIAYLGSALAAAATQSKGGRRGASIAIIFGLLVVYTAIAKSLPEISVRNNTLFRELLERIPNILFALIFSAGCTYATGYLMDKKISL